MDKKDLERNEFFDEEYGKHEFIAITFATIVIILAWNFSSGTLIELAGRTYDDTGYVLASINFAIIITLSIIRIFGHKVVHFVADLVGSKEKGEAA